MRIYMCVLGVGMKDRETDKYRMINQTMIFMYLVEMFKLPSSSLHFSPQEL